MSRETIQLAPTIAQLERICFIQNTVDPDRVLPPVRLSEAPCDEDSVQAFCIYSGSTQVGRCFIDSGPAMTRWISTIDIFDGNGPVAVNFQRRGFGTATYLAAVTQAIREGYSFRTDIRSESLGVKKLWEKLAQVGVARVIVDYKPNGYGTYNGLYVVDHAVREG